MPPAISGDGVEVARGFAAESFDFRRCHRSVFVHHAHAAGLGFLSGAIGGAINSGRVF